MIPLGETSRRFQKERIAWKREAATEYVLGIRKGIAIGISIVEELGEQAKRNRKEYTGTLDPWSAQKFHHVLFVALKLLSRGDRKKAIQVMEDAIEHKCIE